MDEEVTIRKKSIIQTISNLEDPLSSTNNNNNHGNDNYAIDNNNNNDNNNCFESRASIYVNTIDKNDLANTQEDLTAEFRHRLGILPDEEQELSEIFKSKLGLNYVEDNELLKLLSHKNKDIKDFSMEKYAKKNFRKLNGKDVLLMASKDPLQQALLMKESPLDDQASVYISAAIHRFMEGEMQTRQSVKKSSYYVPVLMRIMNLHNFFQSSSSSSSPSSPPIEVFEFSEKEKKKFEKNTKFSMKKLFRSIRGSTKPSSRNSSVEESPSYESLLSDLKGDLETMQFIVAHGILKPQLRDEIFCQLCCQVIGNNDKEQIKKGWILHSLCIATFLPSVPLLRAYINFLNENKSSHPSIVAKIQQNILRTNQNGFRFHPPNSIELNHELDERPIEMEIILTDEKVVKVTVDTSCTSLEICNSIAKDIQLEDSFGFSLFITIYEKISSLGCGNDHVMDALTECEYMTKNFQMSSALSSTFPSTPWRFFYRKELFTPWYDPGLDSVSSHLIYSQIKAGIVKGELKISQPILAQVISQVLFVEEGRLDSENKVRIAMENILRKDMEEKDGFVDEVVKVSKRLKLNGEDGDEERKRAKNNLLSSASQYFSINFSALFETFNFGSFPQLPEGNLIVALNSTGFYVFDQQITKSLAYFRFCDIFHVKFDSQQNLSSSTFTVIAMDGNEYKLASPNSEVITKTILAFLTGLSRRSKWAIAIKRYLIEDFRNNKRFSTLKPKDQSFELKLGDLIELSPEADEENKNQTDSGDFLYGFCERTMRFGFFPPSVVYVIPTTNKPSEEYLDMLRQMGKQGALQSSYGNPKGRIIMADIDTVRREPDSNA